MRLRPCLLCSNVLVVQYFDGFMTVRYCDHRTCISSRIEESARTLVVLDVDG